MNLRYLFVQFDTEIEPYNVHQFRGAMIDKVGREHHWFHNHQESEEDGQAVYQRYSMIQYKCDHRQPVMLFLGNCVEEASHFFKQADWTLQLDGETRPLSIYKLDLKEYEVQILSEMRTYTIFNWQALNTHNYKIYRDLEGLTERLQFLDNLLRSQLLAFASGIGWQVEDTVKVAILDVIREGSVNVKGNHLKTFTLKFKTNMFLPDYIGIGRMVSKGYGMVRLG